MKSANIITPIIPVKPIEVSVNHEHQLDLKAICIFTAIGFFLESDTYWKDKKVLTPAAKHQLDEKGVLIKTEPYFNWYYEPENITFNQALERFTELFESIINEQTEGKKIILPLSGGLDSRTQAAALLHKKEQVHAYSYKFARGYDEVKIARELADKAGFKFKEFEIPEGYLWGQLENLAQLNKCTSDFTSPRQMAVREHLGELGNLFSLGHWGDVLFDDMKVQENADFDSRVELILKKIVKSGGMELAQDLWTLWDLEGTFKDYLYQRIEHLMAAIEIPQSANAHIRAFKSMYWAPRWTSVNLAVFESVNPITLPYYDDRMCQFICTVPEEFLKNRQLQIAYIKTKAPKMAEVIWQDHRPFNLFNYSKNRVPYNLPYRINAKIKRTLNKVKGKSYVMRNWELQFLGEQNRKNLEREIFNKDLMNWTSKEWLEKKVKSFYENPVPNTAHPLNMLLVLSKFIQNKENEQ